MRRRRATLGFFPGDQPTAAGIERSRLFCLALQPEAGFAEPIEPAPKQAVHRNDHGCHHYRGCDQQVIISSVGRLAYRRA